MPRVWSGPSWALCVRPEATPVQAAGYHRRSLRQRHACACIRPCVASRRESCQTVRCGVPLLFPSGKNAEAIAAADGLFEPMAGVSISLPVHPLSKPMLSLRACCQAWLLTDYWILCNYLSVTTSITYQSQLHCPRIRPL